MSYSGLFIFELQAMIICGTYMVYDVVQNTINHYNDIPLLKMEPGKR